MCGIVGIWGQHADPATVHAMTSALAHRGPDDEGRWHDAAIGVALGHRRLSILDPTPAGHQPMVDATGRFVVVFNGEIYNFVELADELRQMGHPLRTRCDTEVVIEGYRRWGAGVFERLVGMFAVGLVDRGTAYGGAPFEEYEGNEPHVGPRLVLARDRLGIKPLLWTRRGGSLWFASELAALRADGRLPLEVSPTALADLVSYGGVIQPSTIYDGVEQLAPGSVFAFDRDAALIEQRRFWSLLHQRDAGSGSREELLPELESATRRHLVSDVPIGAFLSGGVDSAAVVALMSRRTDRPIQTFTVGFAEAGDSQGPEDERALARRTAAALGCDHHEVAIQPLDAGTFDAFIDAIDQPSVDGINTWLVGRAASEHVRVVIGGLGADELFAGYPHFGDYAAAVGREPSAADRLKDRLYRVKPSASWRAAAMRCRSGFDALDLARRRRAARSSLHPRILDAVDPPASGSAAMRREYEQLNIAHRPPLQRMSWYELRGYLQSTLLRDTDAASMAHGLELRPIFLDHHVVELAFDLPDAAKRCGERSKLALHDAVRELLPAEVFDRPKRGFELPYRHWLTTTLRDRFERSLHGAWARRVMRPEARVQLRWRLRAGRLRSDAWLWMVTLAWLERHHPL